MPTTAKIQVRSGDLADLPILAPSEFGYAKNAQRLFIGNDPVTASPAPDGSITNFDFGIDFDNLQKYNIVNQDDDIINSTTVIPSNPGTSVTIALDDSSTGTTATDYTFFSGFTITSVKKIPSGQSNSAPLTITTDYTVDYSTNTVTLTSAPLTTDTIRIEGAPSTGYLYLEYNTEVYTVEPDSGLQLPTTVQLAGSASPAVNTGVYVDKSENQYVQIQYTLSGASGERRTGVITVGIDINTSTFTIDDSYTSNATGTDLDHIFTGNITNNTFSLQYTCTDISSRSFSWITKNW